MTFRRPEVCPKEFPFIEILSRQLVRLTFDDRAQYALLIDAKIRSAGRPHGDGHPLKRAIAFQSDVKRAQGVLSFDPAIGHFPAAIDLRLKQRAPSCGVVRGLTL